MKIRTITVGCNLDASTPVKKLQKAAGKAQKIKEVFQQQGYAVQTVRIATQPWEKYFMSPQHMEDLVFEIDRNIKETGLDFFNIGTTFSAENIPHLERFLGITKIGFATATVCGQKKINHEAVRQAARIMKRLSRFDGNGFANLRFAAVFNTQPGSPFFPASYHKGPMSFALGTENSDLVYQAFSAAGCLSRAAECLAEVLEAEYRRLEKVAEMVSSRFKIKYGGIDVSIASSVSRTASIAFAFEKLGLGKFGESGTLTAARLITDVLKKLRIKRCGYSGLMLPVLEDFGLAQRNKEGAFDLMHLLLYSAVCGTGLDTIPLPGNVSEKRLYALLLDIASLSVKLNKPLSARLMPVPGKKAGEMTEFDFPYFVNTRIMSL